jgi:uncharacterized protein (DUF1501 family)
MSMLSRRNFLGSVLRGSTLVALSPAVPNFLAQVARAASPMKDGRVLVVVQMDGGNDGINTIVPYKDEGYAKYRTELRLPASSLVKVNDQVGLHPAMGDAGKLLEDGRLAIVQGVGYPNPDRSHFTSMAIWHSARPDGKDKDALGWIGHALDGGTLKQGVPSSVFAGTGELPPILRGRKAVAARAAFSRRRQCLQPIVGDGAPVERFRWAKIPAPCGSALPWRRSRPGPDVGFWGWSRAAGVAPS